MSTMIPSWPGLQMIYALILFQTMSVFCNTISMEELRKIMQQAIGYDLDAPLENGKVLIWKISGNHEPFTSMQYNGEPVQFGSNETYLLLTNKGQISTYEPLKTLMIYYWLGGSTSLIDKKMTGKYAELLVQFLRMKHGISKRMSIAREIEGMESDSFQHTMKMFNRHANALEHYDEFTMYLDIHFPSPRPNLYVVQGDDENSRFKKIPLSSGVHWLMNQSACLVLEVEYKVENMWPMKFYCGARANSKKVKRSSLFSYGFYNYITISRPYELKKNKYLTNGKHTSDFKQFLEVLEDIKFYNPNETDYSNDHLKNGADFVTQRDEEISLFDITSDGLEENPSKPFYSSNIQGDRVGYLLDTKSVAGVFLQLGDSNNINSGYMDKTIERPTAIQLAEEYMDRMYPLSEHKVKMRIMLKQIYRSMIDFELNFTGYNSIDYV